jgi:hypothetical protein
MAQSSAYSIVLLYENPANSLQVVQSLKDKDIDVHVVQTAGELIQIISGQSFDLVGLSVNHASTKSLVQVLKSRTQVAVLAFGEDKSPATARAVTKTAADFQIIGAITSYNIWMKIGHLVKEKQRHHERTSMMLNGKMPSNMDDDNQSAMIIKSSAKGKQREKDAKQVSHVKSIEGRIAAKKSSPQHQERTSAKEETGESSLVEDISEETANLTAALEQEQKKNLPKIAQKKTELGMNASEDSIEPAENTAPAKTLEESILAGDLNQDTENAPEEAPLKNKGLLGTKKQNDKKSKGNGGLIQINKKPQREGELHVINNESKPNTGKTIFTEDEQIDREIDQMQNIFFDKNGESSLSDLGTAVIQGEESGDIGGVIMPEPTEQKDVELIFQEMQKASKGKNTTADPLEDPKKDIGKIISFGAAKEKKKRKQPVSVKTQEPSFTPMEKLKFKKLFRDAVSQAAESDFKKVDRLEIPWNTSKISVIPVESHKEKGFLLIANSENEYATAEETSGFKDALTEQMKQKNEEFSLGDTLNIETFEVDMSSWATKSSQFHYNFETNSGKKIIICFLKRDPVFPKTRKHEQQDMHRIDLHELPPKMPVSFNAYLFLNRNNKMLPYIRRGGSLSSKQIERLYKSGFKFLYVKEDEVLEYYTFCISHYLNQDFRTVRRFAA